VLGHEIEPPALLVGEIPHRNEHRAERGNEVHMGTILVLLGDPRRKLGARSFPNQQSGSH